MAQPASSVQGRFVWHENMTPDLEGSTTFYTRLFGWSTRPMDMGLEGPYTVFQNHGADVGGAWKMDAAQGSRAAWIAYATVPDVDAAAAAIPDLGGEILTPPTDVPGVGRFAMLRDPHGAVISSFRFGGEAPPLPAGSYPVGSVCWNELVVPDPDEAMRFYTEVFGWTARRRELPGIGDYRILQRDGKDAAGIRRPPDGAPCPTGWMIYIRVDDVDRVADQVVELGGRVMSPAQDIDGIGRYAVLADPSGGVFAVLRPDGQKRPA
jgi:predicted enzyme related to lactoylglutathione lyase